MECVLALLAQFYAGLNQYDGRKVKLSDVRQKPVLDYVRRIESATVHYGESTGFFAEKMFDQGSQYLTAAILYENLVYEANSCPTAFPASHPPRPRTSARCGHRASPHPAKPAKTGNRL